MKTVFHGGGLDAAIAEYGGTRSEWLDLSTGINPNPYPVPEISIHDWSRLPDKSAEQSLISAARVYYGVPDGTDVVAANGTQALIQLLPNVVTAKKVTILTPTYGEYRHVWQSAGREVAEVSQLDQVPADTDVLLVVNPNNPDGRTHDPDELVSLAGNLRYLVVDEAFADTEPGLSMVPYLGENTIVLKSFGKFFGLAGARLGFAVCNQNLGNSFRSALGPWAVSGPAISIGTSAFADEDWIQSTRKSLKETSGKLAKLLTRHGLKVQGENPLFMYIHNIKATELHAYLAQHRVLVRYFHDRPGYLRFGIPANADELARLETALTGFDFG